MRWDMILTLNGMPVITLHFHRSDLIWFVPYKKSHGETRYNVHFKESLHIENLDLNYWRIFKLEMVNNFRKDCLVIIDVLVIEVLNNFGKGLIVIDTFLNNLNNSRKGLFFLAYLFIKKHLVWCDNSIYLEIHSK